MLNEKDYEENYETNLDINFGIFRIEKALTVL